MVAGNSNSASGTCGRTEYDIANGHIEGASITVWTHDSDGDTCAPLSDVLAHEFGHLLGLADAPDSSCIGQIMGQRFGGDTRSVSADDCAVADDKWETSTESQTYYDPFCDAYCWTACQNNVCPQRPPWMDGCPILMDLEGDGIRLTGLNDPVWFDIDADGELDLLSWTDRGEGLLVLDRNGDGSINDGGELFGNGTRLFDGTRALNGYLALAEFDTWIFAGNGDGVVDERDPAFHSLRLWSDLDHDGVSQGAELFTLKDVGILGIGVDYRRSHRTDRHGNEFRFLGRAWRTGPGGRSRPVLTWDVFFLVAR